MGVMPRPISLVGCDVKLSLSRYLYIFFHFQLFYLYSWFPATVRFIEIFFFFAGTSVDITSTLLDMFDTIVAKNTTENAPQQRTAPLPCDPGGGLGNGQQDTPNKRFPPPPCISVTTTGGRPVRAYSKRSYSDTVFNVSVTNLWFPFFKIICRKLLECYSK